MPRPAAADAKPTASRFIILGTLCLVVAILHFAQEVLIPIALAILLSFLLAPLVRVLERLRLPRAVAVILSVVIGFGVVAGLGFVVYRQFVDVATHAQSYADNVKGKIEGMQGEGGLLNWFSHAKADAAKLLKLPTSQPATQSAPADAPPDAPPAAEAAPVRVVNQVRDTSPLGMAESVLATVIGPAGTAFIVVVFTVFMLLQREDLRDRVIRLVGRDRLTTTTEALDDAAGRVSRYLLYQTIVNATVGAVIAGLLFGEGQLAGTKFPSPLVWGLLSGLMRFIPYVGIWISAAVPILLSVAVFASFKWTFVTIGIYLVTELVTANAIEPMLFGSSTGLGSLAVLVAAAFWTWLWGPVGLLLSTPMTVCVVVMGKYVPALGFLNILLSDEPALPPPDRLYQRLLALDNDEAADLVDEYAAAMPIDRVYDDVILPALALAEVGGLDGRLPAARLAAIHAAVRDIAADQFAKAKAAAKPDPRAKQQGSRVEHAEVAAAAAGRGSVDVVAVNEPTPHLPDGCVLNVLCLPAHGSADELAATLLGHLLELRGYCVTILSAEQLAGEMVAAAEAAKADAVIISALPPGAVRQAKYLAKRLHGHVPDGDLIVGLWTARGDLQRSRRRVDAGETTRMAGTLAAAIADLHEIAQPKLTATAAADAADRPVTPPATS